MPITDYPLPRNAVEARRWIKRYWAEQIKMAETMPDEAQGSDVIARAWEEETMRLARAIEPPYRVVLDEPLTLADKMRAVIMRAGSRGVSVRELKHASHVFRNASKEEQDAAITRLLESGEFSYEAIRKSVDRSGPPRKALVYRNIIDPAD